MNPKPLRFPLLKPLAIATATALYSAAVVHAAGLHSGTTKVAGAVAQVPYASVKTPTATATTTAAEPQRQGRPGGRNQQVRPASQRDKFQAEPERTGQDIYIVRLHDMPVALYDGRIKDYAATSKRARAAEAAQQGSFGKWLSKGLNMLGLPGSDKAKISAYKSYLQDKQQDVLSLARAKGISAAVRLNYTEALNGFSLKLTQDQAKALAELPQVAYVQRSKLQKLLSDRGPEYIGADKVWTGTSVTGLAQQGEGQVVGIIDTGINSDHVSFAAVGDDGYTAVNPLGAGNYLGDCANGVLACNDKLIGIWSWPVITNTFAGVKPASGEDYNGHGSHTASTTAGNVVTNAPLMGTGLGDGDGVPTGFTFDRVSGVAPHANIIAYQACFPNDGCPDEAIVKSIEQAIIDNVDVINFSIGGGERFPWEDATEMAFLAAREAGIAVAVAAGNAGTDGYGERFYSLGHSAPWTLPVAAATHDRVMTIATAKMGLSGDTTPPSFYYPPDWSPTSELQGAGISTSAISNGNLVSAAAYGDELCANAFAPGSFSATQIVVCKRGGGIARVSKAANVMAGGAGGFVLYNAGYPDDQDDVVNDVYPLPGLHIRAYDGQQLVDWIGNGGSSHTGSIAKTDITRSLDPSQGSVLAAFSSRGPVATFGGHLAPGISAPGVDIFAAYADEHPFNNGLGSRDWDMISGTSMASPHVAGAMTLVRQAHPEWTASEIQSALQLTATDNVTKPAIWDGSKPPARQHRGGSGMVDVLAAVNAGLVMDETASNFEWANPRNGGDVKQLNLPQLVNNNCRNTCTWMRTVKATRDGSWTVSAGDWTYDRWISGEGETRENGVKFTATPAAFSLQAGESRTIIMTADITDTQYRRNGFNHVNASEEVELWSSITLTPDSGALPAAHLPVSINFDHGVLPKNLELTAHRDHGSYRLSQVALPAIANASYRGFGLTKATVETVTLAQDTDHQPVQWDGDFSPNHTQVTLVNVPDGTARLVTEVLKTTGSTAEFAWQQGKATLAIGIDANGNGQPDFADETLCISNTEIELNYCNITQPDPGSYWIMVANVRGGDADGYDNGFTDTYRIATGVVVPGTLSSNFTVSGPASSTGAPADLNVNWSLSEMAVGDIAYGGFDVGPANAPGTVGFVPVKLTRGVDDVSLTASQTRARIGDVVDVALHVLANNSGVDRAIDLASNLPAGLSLVPGSVKITSSQQANLHSSATSISVQGQQQNSENWTRDYNITTSKTDAMCRTATYNFPNGYASNGGFIGMVKNGGFQPDFGGSALDLFGDVTPFTIPLNQFWDKGGYALYNNDENQLYPSLLVSPTGFVALDPWAVPAYLGHAKFPLYASPYTPLLGVFWKGFATNPMGSQGKFLGTPLNVDWFNPDNTSGITMANASTGDMIFEWVGARTEFMDFWSWPVEPVDQGDRYSFNLVLNENTRFDAGQYEMIMAYGDMNFASEGGEGSIGVHGHHGALDIFGYPYVFESGKGFAHNDLKTKLSKDLVVCYDYVGPESTQFDLSFQVRVSELAAGQDQVLTFNSAIAGMGSRTLSHTISVNSNLQMATIPDQTVVENTKLSGIRVDYNDSEANPNRISVSGANVTATINGHSSGSTFDLMPAQNFEGTTEVTVTVADQNNPSDKVSTRFTLTVTKGSDIVTPPPPAESNGGSGGGGSMPWFMLLTPLLLLLQGRRVRK